jgi:sulfoxide reductase heme-binding subunit YedZ
MTQNNKVLLLKLVIHLAAFIPLFQLYYLAFIDELGADPVEAVIHFTGIGSLNLLLITLCVSPLAKILKQGFFMQVRRLLGIYAFVYALFHLTNFLAFEVQFDFTLFLNEIFERPYITVGMVAFVIISILAITSLNTIKKKLGKKWQPLHNTTYLLTTLVLVHFYWSVKSELITPLFYFLLFFLLLAFRHKKIKRIYLSLFSK